MMKTIYIDPATGRFCSPDDPNAEAREVLAKRVRRVGRRLYRLRRCDDGQLVADPLPPRNLTTLDRYSIN